MLTRRFAFRTAIVSAGLMLLVAIFLPVVFVLFMAGGFAPQYGSGSLFSISPAAATVLMFAVGVSLGVSLGAALVAEPRRQSRWLGPVGGVLLGSALMATAYTFSPFAAFRFHPAGMSAVALGGLFLIIAARLGRRVGPSAA